MLLLWKFSIIEFYSENTDSLKQPPTPLVIKVIDGRRNSRKFLTFKGKLQISSLFHYWVKILSKKPHSWWVPCQLEWVNNYFSWFLKWFFFPVGARKIYGNNVSDNVHNVPLMFWFYFLCIFQRTIAVYHLLFWIIQEFASCTTFSPFILKRKVCVTCIFPQFFQTLHQDSVHLNDKYLVYS